MRKFNYSSNLGIAYDNKGFGSDSGYTTWRDVDLSVLREDIELQCGEKFADWSNETRREWEDIELLKLKAVGSIYPILRENQ